MYIAVADEHMKQQVKNPETAWSVWFSCWASAHEPGDHGLIPCQGIRLDCGLNPQ